MIVQLFRPFTSDEDTFQGNKIADISGVASFVYIKRFTGVGDFTMTVPLHRRYADRLAPDIWLLADYKYWLIVRDVDKSLTNTGVEVYLKGVDLKGLLQQRITLYGLAQDTGTTGYDVIQGPTETCIKHYIKNNITQPEDDARRIPGFVIAPDQKRGIAEDTYMSRFENLADLTNTLCQNAKIGYDVTADLAENKLVFDVITPRDYTEGQRENNRVVFAVDRGNVSRMQRTRSLSNLKNAFYATLNGGTLTTDAITQLVYREEDVSEPPVGVYRREMQMNISITEQLEGEQLSDIQNLARKEAVNYEAADSYECKIKGTNRLDLDYRLGDFITVKDFLLGDADKQITEATLSYGTESPPLSLTMGEKQKKIINILNDKTNQKGV